MRTIMTLIKPLICYKLTNCDSDNGHRGEKGDGNDEIKRMNIN